MSIDIISNNTTKSNQCLNNEIDNNLELVNESFDNYEDLDCSEPLDESYDTVLTDPIVQLEINHCNLEEEIEEAILFAKEILKDYQFMKINGKPTLAYHCVMFLKTQYKEHFVGKWNIHTDKQLKVDFRINWDQNFIDFIRAKLWECIKANHLISDPWPITYYYNNKFYNNYFDDSFKVIFENIQVELYRFAAGVIEYAPHHILGF